MLLILSLAVLSAGILFVALRKKSLGRLSTEWKQKVKTIYKLSFSPEEKCGDTDKSEEAGQNSSCCQTSDDVHPMSPIFELKERLSKAFKAEISKGHSIGLHQEQQSANRLQEAVLNHIQQYFDEGHQDWKNYVNFNEHHYVRNLIFANDDFELMVICWRYGQGSRVHNHGQSHCWLSVLQGCVQEHQYQMPTASDVSSCPAAPPSLPGVLSSMSPCPRLCHMNINELQVGQVGYINDSIALHAVRVPEHCEGQGAVTLHLYAPPIRKVTLFEPDNNRVVQRQPGFFTVGLGHGRRKQASCSSSLSQSDSAPQNWDI